jgi:Ca-activated chloride channel homolog
MNTRRLGVLLFFFQMLLHLGCMAAFPMTKGNEDPVIKADVVLVPVDVLVRDKAGAIIDNLRGEDFVVYDNGVAQQISLFSHEEIPLDVALVVDNSGSEAPYILELQDTALTVLQNLNPKSDRVALFCFNQEIIQLTGLTQDRFLLKNRIGKMSAGGGTNITDALWEAAHYIRSKGANRRRAIILVSDNVGTGRVHSSKEALDEMLEAGVILYDIRTSGANFPFSAQPIPQTLSAIIEEIAQLALKTGGEVLDVNSTSKFQNALTAAILRLKRSYTLGFYPSDKGKEGSYHTLKVKLPSYSGYSLQFREGYYVPKASVSNTDKKARAADSSFSSIFPQSQPFYVGLKRLDLQSLIARIQQMDDNDIDAFNQESLPLNKRLDFTATGKRNADSKGKQNATIDLKIDATQLFFRFVDGQYKGSFSVLTLQPNSYEADGKRYELNYQEEGFGQAIQSKISLSITAPPPKKGNIRIIIVQPETNFFGVQSVQIQP